MLISAPAQGQRAWADVTAGRWRFDSYPRYMKSLDASGGSVFRKLSGPAMPGRLRAAASLNGIPPRNTATAEGTDRTSLFSPLLFARVDRHNARDCHVISKQHSLIRNLCLIEVRICSGHGQDLPMLRYKMSSVLHVMKLA